jgi:hypothetical protein
MFGLHCLKPILIWKAIGQNQALRQGLKQLARKPGSRSWSWGKGATRGATFGPTPTGFSVRTSAESPQPP